MTSRRSFLKGLGALSLATLGSNATAFALDSAPKHSLQAKNVAHSYIIRNEYLESQLDYKERNIFSRLYASILNPYRNQLDSMAHHDSLSSNMLNKYHHNAHKSHILAINGDIAFSDLKKAFS